MCNSILRVRRQAAKRPRVASAASAAASDDQLDELISVATRIAVALESLVRVAGPVLERLAAGAEDEGEEGESGGEEGDQDMVGGE